MSITILLCFDAELHSDNDAEVVVTEEAVPSLHHPTALIRSSEAKKTEETTRV